MGRLVHGGTSGGKQTKEYRAWIHIRRRCVRGDVEAFARYGAAGIRMADEWRDDFGAFLAHIGKAPTANHSVDRIDNARGYEPGNVRWATSAEQNRNKRFNLYVEVDGNRRLFVEVCEELGLEYHAAHGRLKRGRMPFKIAD